MFCLNNDCDLFIIDLMDSQWRGFCAIAGTEHELNIRNLQMYIIDVLSYGVCQLLLCRKYCILTHQGARGPMEEDADEDGKRSLTCYKACLFVSIGVITRSVHGPATLH